MLTELRAHPHDRERLLVHADWLQARGHPRGELIAVQDLAERCARADQYAWASARSRAILASAKQLSPLAGDAASAAYRAWATWSCGFVRRLELLILDEAFGPAQLEGLLDHPSLALLEYLLIRVDSEHPAPPTQHAPLALELALGALAERVPLPPLRLDLWTSTLPEPGQRERLAHGLRALQATWFSLDMTMIPPPRRHPATRLLPTLADLRRRGAGTVEFDMFWVDTRREFLARLDARSGVTGGVEYDLMWSVHLRRMADHYARCVAPHDPLPTRAVHRALAPLAARFDPLTSHFTPPAPVSVELLPRAAAFERFAALDVGLAPLEQLRAFDPDLRWTWLERSCSGSRWRGLVGLGAHELLGLGVRGP